MDIKILKPCVIDGKSYKSGKKKVTVSKKDGAVLVSLGKAEDLSPKEEMLSLDLNVDLTAFENLKTEIETLTEANKAKDEEIEALKTEIETLTEANKAKDEEIEALKTEIETLTEAKENK